jgi:rare lipoprotein A (peptidoglycan hydrolase)
MRHRIFVTVELILLALGFLAFTPSGNPNAAKPVVGGVDLRKPLKVWTCSASWYGKDFDGKPTATGEIYDMYAATAAHPALPLGSIVRVVNMRNQRSQVVRINDRGPYVEGRGLDVSYAVARRLDFDKSGIAKVRVELLEVPSRITSE